MSQNYSFDRDVKEALAMAEGLSEYVRGERLYGSLWGASIGRGTSLTGGSLLLRLRRLHLLRAELKDFQVKNLDKALDLYEKVRTEWAYHYETKLNQEAHSRIDAMKAFFYECKDDMRDCIGIYKPEIFRRTVVEEIVFELENLNASDDHLLNKVKACDAKLRTYVEPADFQWSEELAPAYDKDDFWWLYHSPPNLR